MMRSRQIPARARRSRTSARHLVATGVRSSSVSSPLAGGNPGGEHAPASTRAGDNQQSPVMAMGLRRNDKPGQNRLRWDSGPAPPKAARPRAARPASRPHYARSPGPRIDQLVEQVRKHVDSDEADPHDDGSTEDGVHVTVEQGAGDVLPNTRPGEHGLGQYRALEKRCVGQPDDGDELHEDVAEGMAPNDVTLGESL